MLVRSSEPFILAHFTVESSSMEAERIIAGIDEAGYGPLFGPYVLGSAFFSFREEGDLRTYSPPFWERLTGSVSRTRKENRLFIADSKLVYKRNKGVSSLEEGIFSFLSVGRTPAAPAGFRELLEVLGGGRDELDRYPWYADGRRVLPSATFLPLIRSLSGRLDKDLRGASYEFLGLRTRVVRAGEFNALVKRFNNKSQIGLYCIGAVLQGLWEKCRRKEVLVCVDKQGGRAKYARFLWETLQPKKIIGICEEKRCSAYCIEGADGRRLFVRFLEKGDRKSFPVALASMAAKYVRELHMELFNNYFRALCGDKLRPTAGYVQDGRRFLSEIEPVLVEKQIRLEMLIRQR